MKFFFILFFISLFLLSSCSYSKSIYLNNNTYSSCLLECKFLMENKYYCLSTTINYNSFYENLNLQNISCECIMLDCYGREK